MSYCVIFSQEAKEHIGVLYDYIADCASAELAKQYTEAIICFCEALRVFPHRGTLREDLRPGLRITHYKKRTVIAFAVDDAAQQVFILGLFYGGQNYKTLLQHDVNEFAEE